MIRGRSPLAALLLAGLLLGAAPTWGTKLPDGRLAPLAPRVVEQAPDGLFDPAGADPATASHDVPAHLAAALDVAGGGPARVVHPGGRWGYVALEGLVGQRGVLQVVDLWDPDRPRLGAQVPLGLNMVPRDLAVDAEGDHLFVTTGTHTIVLDLTDPAAPSMTGRISDYMVRNHQVVTVTDVVDTYFGIRRFLTVTSELGGGTGCPTGTVHVYDITGDLLQRPLMVAESDIPDDVPDGGACPTASISLDRTVRRMRVTWSGDGTPRTDWFPFDTTAAFYASGAAQFCILVQV